jgi:two-component system KDP operon response regulator KdpE
MTETKDKILVVDDEPQIGKVLRRSLQARGFDVRVATDGESAFDIFRAFQPDLVISDLAMPNVDGIALCKTIRKSSHVPIIVLSVKGEEEIKVEALDSGADDYVIKPFGMDELLARVRALLRRSARPAAEPETEFELGDFRVDPKTRTTVVSGREVRLTPKEYELLLYFLSRHSTVLTHKAILEAIWGSNSTNQNEYLRVFVGQLRKKIERNPASPRYIKTEPWIGYRFDPGL